jgi:hypothetical protein
LYSAKGSDGSKDPGSPVGSLLIDQSKTASRTGTHPYKATTLSGPSRPTTPTDNSVEMTKTHILDCWDG